MLKGELLENGPYFLSRRCKQLIPAFAGTQKAPEESSYRFKNSLLYHSEHLGKPSLHVFDQNKMSKSVTNSRLGSMGCFLSIL